MRKTILLTGLAALMFSAPAIADKPDTTGKPADRPATSQGPKSEKRCKVHKRAYIVRGTLVSQALTKNTDGSYDGTITVNVTNTNKAARGDKGTEKTYTLDDTTLKLNVPDRNADTNVDLADTLAGDRVKLTGKITFRNKKCTTGAFTPATSFRRVTIAAPEPAPAPAPAPVS